MSYTHDAALLEPHVSGGYDPLKLAQKVGGRPNIDFKWKEVHGKRRLIGNPNRPMREIHELFRESLEGALKRTGDDGYTLRRTPSSTAFVRGSNPLKNVQRHVKGMFFYITDVRDAYPSVNHERLAALLVYVWKHAEYRDRFSARVLGSNVEHQRLLMADPLFQNMFAFLELFCSGPHMRGLAIGGPLSPILFNLYSEVYMDTSLRRVCERHDIVYTRYADDLVFSREKPIISGLRRDLRNLIVRGGFAVNHRKSRVLSRAMGTVFVTKIGLRNPGDADTVVATIVYPQRKRRKLHKLINDYLSMRMDWPEKVSGYIAEFLHYYKNVDAPTRSDLKTFSLCKKFKAEWSKYCDR